MKELNKNPESTVLIRFPDCDPLKHLNNARYIDYFMNAREDHLMNAYDLNVYDYPKETGAVWVVAQNQIAYVRPAWFMETVVIQSTLLHAGNRKLLVEMRMLNADKTELKAVIWAVFAHFDVNTQRSIEHLPEMMDFLKSVENPLPEAIDFDARVSELKAKYRKEAVVAA